MAMQGRTILVTGASAGIGAEISRNLAAQGARVALVARRPDHLEAVRASLQGEGHINMPFDLSEIDAIPPRFRQFASDYGPIHGVMHCAGLMLMRPLRMLTSSDWETSMRINVASASALAKGFRQNGVNAGGGSIVFISSITGLIGQPAQSLYSATKGALIAMARALAIELAREKIRVNCVAPGVVEAGMSEQLKSGMTQDQWNQLAALHPLGIGRAEDVANAVTFLLADTSRWITGTTLVVDGGYTAQ